MQRFAQRFALKKYVEEHLIASIFSNGQDGISEKLKFQILKIC